MRQKFVPLFHISSCNLSNTIPLSKPLLTYHFNWSVQEKHISMANTLELHLSCTNPSNYETPWNNTGQKICWNKDNFIQENILEVLLYKITAILVKAGIG